MTLRLRCHRAAGWLGLALALTVMTAVGEANPQRKALVIGRGDPFREPGGGATHPQCAKDNFLRYVGNPSNDPAKGWTCDLSWDLIKRLGLNPTNTTTSELFAYLKQHDLGYRIAMHNFAGGANLSGWGDAVANDIMPFAAHGNNDPRRRLEAPPGLQPCVAVAGGRSECENTYGPSLEFFEAVPAGLLAEDTAQSWANQMLASKFAKVLDAHPGYNIWDARQHLRQAASHWDQGWTERNGFGRVNLNARVGLLLPGPPLEFRATLGRNVRQVIFTWRNFLMSDFAATVITRQDGRIIYEGSGTNFTWTTDHDGAETFTYVSKNRAGKMSRIESFQTRTVTGLKQTGTPACLILAEPGGKEPIASKMSSIFAMANPNWLCGIACRTNSRAAQWVGEFENGGRFAAALPDFGTMVDFAVSNRYRLVVAPATDPEVELSHHAPHWERAWAAGVAVVIPHNAQRHTPGGPKGRQLRPARLGAAITVGLGVRTNEQTYGPGLEFFDAPANLPGYSQNAAAAALAARLAAVMDANPRYNPWDARQHLRQSASHYAEGWREDGGYGRPAAEPLPLARLELGPPLEIQAQKSADGQSVTCSWLNFRQSDFAATVITRADGAKLYEGAGTNFVWRSDKPGAATFKFFTKGKSGALSREENYTTVRVEGLAGK